MKPGAKLFVLSVDGYVIGAYTSRAKAKAAWLKWRKAAIAKDPDLYSHEDKIDPFKYTTIKMLKGVDQDVDW